MKCFLTGILLAMTCFAAATPLSDSMIMRQHLVKITQTAGFRHAEDTQALHATARYITTVFARYADTVYTQPFMVEGKRYYNVIASFGVQHTSRIIVGAHYDVCGEQQGADDNASGVTGLLELARLLNEKKAQGRLLKKRIDLVAFTLEEPPFFRTDKMGSYVHAASMLPVKKQVEGMICLEMIGYFSDEKGSQQYPVAALQQLYGDKGDFITIVRQNDKDQFGRNFAGHFKNAGLIRTEFLTAPAGMEGVDYSDHLNYWKFGFNAMMITDTSFFRNTNYHTNKDTIDTLDLNRMGKVIDATLQALMAVAG